MSLALTDILYAERPTGGPVIPGKVLGQDIVDLVAANLEQGFSVFPIYAEESQALSNNNREWSFGDTSNGNVNITMFACEVFAISMDAEISGTSLSIELMRNDAPVVSTLFTADSDYNDLATPISFSQGDGLGFRTGVETGTYNDVRVCAWCRVPLLGLRGPAGIDGTPGPPGTPSQVARVLLLGQGNVNSNGAVLALNGTSINTVAGLSIIGNTINLPVGIYKVTLEVDLVSTATRGNIGFTFLKDGTPYSSRSGGNYVRNASGHSETGDSVSDLIEYTTAGTLSFQTSGQAGGGGAATDLLNTSRILIQKIS